VTADLALLEESTRRLRRQGFVGRVCIHPAQLEVVHRVFTPTEDEIAGAAQVLELYDQAVARGSGVLLDPKGRLVDLAVLRGARKTLALASRAAG
jgi:citrate lyase subunit beta/citryl-CoA lyase